MTPLWVRLQVLVLGCDPPVGHELTFGGSWPAATGTLRHSGVLSKNCSQQSATNKVVLQMKLWVGSAQCWLWLHKTFWGTIQKESYLVSLLRSVTKILWSGQMPAQELLSNAAGVLCAIVCLLALSAWNEPLSLKQLILFEKQRETFKTDYHLQLLTWSALSEKLVYIKHISKGVEERSGVPGVAGNITQPTTWLLLSISALLKIIIIF